MFHDMGAGVEGRRGVLVPALTLLMALLLAFGNAQGFDETRYFN